jgi:electron transfer flavoprotein beta subunit
LKILVLIKSVLDAKIPLEFSEETGRLKEGWNATILNPDVAMAVAQALKIKKDVPEAHITVISLVPPAGERFIRDALALGCDNGLRIWDEGFEDPHATAKALIFSRVAQILGFDLLFTGTRSLDSGSSQLGVLLAASLQVPCITRVICIDEIREGAITATRKLERGYQERIESRIPLVLSFEADEETTSYAPFSAISSAAGKNIPCFDLPRIGIPIEAIKKEEARLKFSPLRAPEPKLQFIQPPDSSLPAFERRRQLGEGAMHKRMAGIVSGEEDAVVEELFQRLLQGGWLNHLKNK